MNNATPGKDIHYLVEISPVQEVTLIGTANLRFWTDHLQREDLVAYHDNGAAQLWIGATAMRWMGNRFKELTISVALCARDDGRTHDGFYLVHAFNSARAFALMERTLFHTPYRHAALEVEARVPASIRLGDAQDIVFQARMTGTRPQVQDGRTVWEGPIHLPSHGPRPRSRHFFARLTGHTTVYPFLHAMDTIHFAPQRDEIWDWLVESSFAGREWRIRDRATHARSRTFRES